MHGLVNRAIQCFLRDTYGGDQWISIARRAGVGPEGFEPMLIYPEQVTTDVLEAACAALDRSVDTILEDVGTYLVSHPNVEALRRLLRFGGPTFADFLLSLEELPDRGRLAVPDLELPAMDLAEPAPNTYVLTCRFGFPGAGHVLLGMLRALADDYGALAYLGLETTEDGADVITINLLQSDFAAGRSFRLVVGDDVR
jgi:hypothetical protein